MGTYTDGSIFGFGRCLLYDLKEVSYIVSHTNREARRFKAPLFAAWLIFLRWKLY